MFYLILIALTGIPLLVVLVVFLIRTIMDFRVWIILGTLITLVGLALLIFRHRKRIGRRIDEEKQDVMEVIRAAAQEGHDVNISFMHGLVRIDYKGDAGKTRWLEAPSDGPKKALPMPTGHAVHQTPIIDSMSSGDVERTSITEELERLNGLFLRGIVTREEFDELKARLLREPEPHG